MLPNTVAVAQPFLIFHLSPNAHSLTLPHRPLPFEVTFGLYIYKQVLMTGSQPACYWGPSSQEAQNLKNSKFVMETRRRRQPAPERWAGAPSACWRGLLRPSLDECRMESHLRDILEKADSSGGFRLVVKATTVG